MRYASLFSGIGGLDCGLARAGLEVVFLCESDEWRRGILAARFPGVPIYADVRDVRGADGADGRERDRRREGRGAHPGRDDAGRGGAAGEGVRAREPRGERRGGDEQQPHEGRTRGVRPARGRDAGVALGQDAGGGGDPLGDVGGRSHRSKDERVGPGQGSEERRDDVHARQGEQARRGDRPDTGGVREGAEGARLAGLREVGGEPGEPDARRERPRAEDGDGGRVLPRGRQPEDTLDRSLERGDADPRLAAERIDAHAADRGDGGHGARPHTERGAEHGAVDLGGVDAPRADADLREVAAAEKTDDAPGGGVGVALHLGPVAREDRGADGRDATVDARPAAEADPTTGSARRLASEGADGAAAETRGDVEALPLAGEEDHLCGDRGGDGAGSGVSDLRGAGDGDRSRTGRRSRRSDGVGQPSTALPCVSRGEVADGSPSRGGDQEGGDARGSHAELGPIELLVGGFP